jgi:hypothetical protein
MDVDWSDNNLSFFLNDNKSNLLIGLYAFQGEGDLVDDMLLTNTKSDIIISSFVPLNEMHILDKKSFFKPLDYNSWRKAITAIALSSAINPIATLALRKKIFRALNLTTLIEYNNFVSSSPIGCHGNNVISVLNLSLIWIAAANNLKNKKNSFVDYRSLFSTFVNCSMAGNFLDQKTAQKAITKSLNVIESISFHNSNLKEVKDIYSDFEKVVDEYDFLETTKEVY